MNEYLFLSPDSTECKLVSAYNIFDALALIGERSRLDHSQFFALYKDWSVYIKVYKNFESKGLIGDYE